MAPSVVRACRSLALSTWLLSFSFVHLLCLDFTVAEKEEWYTAFVNITYPDPVTSEVRMEKTECGRYGEHSPKKEVKGLVLLPSLPQDRQACDPNVRFPPVPQNTAWVALVASGNCTFREKIRNVANLNASAIVIYNVGSSSANDTITMSHPGKRQQKQKQTLHLLLEHLVRMVSSSSLVLMKVCFQSCRPLSFVISQRINMHESILISKPSVDGFNPVKLTPEEFGLSVLGGC